MKLQMWPMMSSYQLASAMLMKDLQQKCLWDFINVSWGVTGQAIADDILTQLENGNCSCNFFMVKHMMELELWLGNLKVQLLV